MEGRGKVLTLQCGSRGWPATFLQQTFSGAAYSIPGLSLDPATNMSLRLRGDVP